RPLPLEMQALRWRVSDSSKAAGQADPRRRGGRAMRLLRIRPLRRQAGLPPRRPRDEVASSDSGGSRDKAGSTAIICAGKDMAIDSSEKTRETCDEVLRGM